MTCLDTRVVFSSASWSDYRKHASSMIGLIATEAAAILRGVGEREREASHGFPGQVDRHNVSTGCTCLKKQIQLQGP